VANAAAQLPREPAGSCRDEPRGGGHARPLARVLARTHSALAERLRWDRSRITHALRASGEECAATALNLVIAEVLDAHAAKQGGLSAPLPPC